MASTPNFVARQGLQLVGTLQALQVAGALQALQVARALQALQVAGALQVMVNMVLGSLDGALQVVVKKMVLGSLDGALDYWTRLAGSIDHAPRLPAQFADSKVDSVLVDGQRGIPPCGIPAGGLSACVPTDPGSNPSMRTS